MLVNALRHFLTHDVDVIVTFVVCVMFVVVAFLQPCCSRTCYLSILVRQESQKYICDKIGQISQSLFLE